jgi:acyl carrier protein
MEQMTMQTIEERVHAFLLEKFPLARKAGLDKNTPLLEKGILDSLGILDVVSFLENEFFLTISDDELLPENFQTLQALSSFVLNKSGKQL